MWSRKFCLATFSWLMLVARASRTNFQLKRFELCNKTQGLMKFRGNVTTEIGEQYATYDLTTPLPWTDQIGGVCLIENKIIGSEFKELFVIREKNFCKAVHKYLGEFWYDLERAAGMPPGQCPLPAGRYHARHVKLDYSKISLQTFPFGRIRFTIRLVGKTNPEVNLLCWLIEVDNSEF